MSRPQVLAPHSQSDMLLSATWNLLARLGVAFLQQPFTGRVTHGAKALG
jgi:hypothetical protein